MLIELVNLCSKSSLALHRPQFSKLEAVVIMLYFKRINERVFIIKCPSNSENGLHFRVNLYRYAIYDDDTRVNKYE